MSLLTRFLNNHVLANLTFALVLVLGILSYLFMPRAKDPQIDLNWINIITLLPGAAAEDVEKRVTDPFEQAIRRSVRDIKFIQSSSREGISDILIRFNELDDRTYDKRVADLRREIQNSYTNELPKEAEDPRIIDVTSSNWFPTATIVVTGAGDDENLRRQARNVKKDLERLTGVDRVADLGLNEPELHIAFYPERLVGLGITPVDIADTVAAYFQDISAGDIETEGGQWIVRLQGTHNDPGELASIPVITAQGVVELGNLAELSRTGEEARQLVRFNGRPAAMMVMSKTPEANVIEIIERLNAYIAKRNQSKDKTGVELFLVDDQTISTQDAISLMQNNAMIGLTLVLLVTWLFLGSRIALLTSIGIPFTLAGTFFVLNNTGMTVNNTVLLGVVIALGMLVDDAVVVVETMYRNLQEGLAGLTAAIAALKEVFAPVTTSVLTTIAAFLPLMLLPGVLGEFMKVIPLVVALALVISLVEAYWMLPAHVIAARINFSKPGKMQRWRENFNHWIRIYYVRILLKALRYPKIAFAAVVLILILAITTVASGVIKFDFFASDATRLFYVNVEMPPGSSLEETTRSLLEVEEAVLKQIRKEELRATVVYAGQMFTETEYIFGDVLGQVMVSLAPVEPGGRHVFDIADQAMSAARTVPGPANITLLRVTDGPPVRKPVSVKVRGDEFEEILEATNHLRKFIEGRPAFNNVAIDFRPGNPVLVLRHDGEAIKRTNLNPTIVNRSIKLFVDGEIVTTFQDDGEEVVVRVLRKDNRTEDIEDLLRQTISLPNGRSTPLGELLTAEQSFSQRIIRHYNFRRAITLEADIDKAQINTVQANDLIRKEWERIQERFPNIDLEFSGELDDINESLNSIYMLFLLGVGLIYIIIGTQFRSYWQPFMILSTVPLAFTGVVLGLLVTRNPLSLYTLYGVVALAGISVNAAIVMISAANSRLEGGMGLLHATIYAARRRVVPIIITSLTTIAGLFSLATGLAGKSLIWGPVATAIVWGLAFSTVLTLIVIPLLYRGFMGRSHRARAAGPDIDRTQIEDYSTQDSFDN